MHPKATHLYRSRHGIWYFRWIVPTEFRRRHPKLPRELKRSTGTADSRHARSLARRLHCELLLRYGTGTNMSSSLDGIRFSGWTLRRDPKTNRITELTVGPGDTPESLARLDRVLEIEAARAHEPASNASVAPPEVAAPQPVPSVLMGQAIERYGRLQVQSEAWTENTFVHAHGPSLRIFREMVGHYINVKRDDGRWTKAMDLPLSELDRSRLAIFLDEFWAFPAQQGKRNEGLTARAIFASGGPPQSRPNVFKRLSHIRQFLAYCVEKGYVNADLLREIDVVLKKDTARSREKVALAKAGVGGVVADGYVAFTPSDIEALFGPQFVQHAAGNPARYWIPLLGLYAGLRVGEASQLRPSDFEIVEGIHCVRVVGEAIGESHDAESQRVKTLASLRTIPLHPKLMQLGLLDYVQQRLSDREKWMWDGLLWTPKSGFGKYPSRDFQKLSERVGVYQPRRKVFHSFRSTISQALERQGLEGNLIDRFLGHEVSSTRNKSYNRTDSGQSFPIERVYEAIKRVDFIATSLTMTINQEGQTC